MAKGEAQRRISTLPLGVEVERGGGPPFMLCSTSSPSSSIPWEWDRQSRAEGQSTPETCSLRHSTGLLSSAGPGLLVIPIKSLEV